MRIGQYLATGDVIVIADASASEPEKYAAKELSKHLEALSGFKVPVRRKIQVKRSSAGAAARRVQLLVGDGAVRQMAPDSISPLGEDEVEARKVGELDLAIRGGGPRGPLYAVYELLEHMGVRWFHPEETFIPKPARVNLPEEIHHKPSFEYREAHWYTAYCDRKFAARMRYNGSIAAVPPRLGGHWGWQPYVHTFFAAVPPEKYARSHPEYYSFRKGQGRVVHGGQLCLSHPDVLDLLTEFALKKMADPQVRIVDLSQMDHANPCECPDCYAKNKKAGSPSGSVLAMCNEVAERTRNVYPDKSIATLAYTYTLKAPRGMKAHPNVIVRLCHMNGCETHPLNGCERNLQFLRHLEAWKKIAERVYIWDYDTNFQHSLYFHPNFDAVRADIRIFRDAGVRGLFLQGYAQRGVACGTRS